MSSAPDQFCAAGRAWARLATVSTVVIATLACQPKDRTVAPTHDELVSDHMRGRYVEVLRWCPRIVEDIGADPAQSDWCLFGYPAALWLNLETKAALAFVRTVCNDLSGTPRGHAEFRIFYVREVVRWYALPLRLGGEDKALMRALPATVEVLSTACSVDPDVVNAGLNTELPTRREAR